MVNFQVTEVAVDFCCTSNTRQPLSGRYFNRTAGNLNENTKNISKFIIQGSMEVG